MTDSDRPKPSPARPKSAKPTPVRELVADPPAPQVEADAPSVTLEHEGEAWTARVTGRAGRASEGATPLLLLGFWKGDPEDERPPLEAWVVGRAVKDLSEETLREALAGATEPPDPARKKPFFAGASQTRRKSSRKS